MSLLVSLELTVRVKQKTVCHRVAYMRAHNFIQVVSNVETLVGIDTGGMFRHVGYHGSNRILDAGVYATC
jgi:hypothetical protein